MTRGRRIGWSALGVAVLGVGVVAGVTATGAQGAVTSTSFDMVRSTAAVNANCVPNAGADVRIVSNGPTETMTVRVHGLPKDTDFDFFVIQVPDAPFGMSWYQGDIQTNDNGAGTGTFVGRFSVETFIVAPGTANAPKPHDGRDAGSNPATGPVHTFHLGLWFNTVADAAKAGCEAANSAPTPFNGTHTAGVQVLSTKNFGDANGPLRRIH
jgi:hypothetical protein